MAETTGGSRSDVAGRSASGTGPAGLQQAAHTGETPGPDVAGRAVPDHLLAAACVLIVGLPLGRLAQLGSGPLLAGVAVAQGFLALAWMLRPEVVGRVGGVVVGALAAVAADLVVTAWPRGELSPLLAVLGFAVPAMFVHQLARGVVRARVTASLSDVAVLVVALVALTALVQLRHETGGRSMSTTVILAMTAALCASHIIDAIRPTPRFDPSIPHGPLGVVAGALVAAVVGYFGLHGTVEFSVGRSILVGAAVGAVSALCAVAFGYFLREPAPSNSLTRLSRAVMSAILPIGIVAPVAYLICLAVRA